MIYIFEGPDGACKTTYAEFISKVTRMPIVHFSNPKTEEEKARMFEIYHDMLTSADNFILDRSWYSEMIYGPILRGSSVISEGQCKELEELLQLRRGKVIYMTNELPVLIDRAFSRGEDLIDKAQFADIVAGYEKLFSTNRAVEVIKYVVG